MYDITKELLPFIFMVLYQYFVLIVVFFIFFVVTSVLLIDILILFNDLLIFNFIIFKIYRYNYVFYLYVNNISFTTSSDQVKKKGSPQVVFSCLYPN